MHYNYQIGLKYLKKVKEKLMLIKFKVCYIFNKVNKLMLQKLWKKEWII